MSPKALGLSEVKEDLFLCTFGCWVREPLPGEGGGMPTTLLGFSVPPSRSLTALVSYWAGTGPPEPRSPRSSRTQEVGQPSPKLVMVEGERGLESMWDLFKVTQTSTPRSPSQRWRIRDCRSRREPPLLSSGAPREGKPLAQTSARSFSSQPDSSSIHGDGTPHPERTAFSPCVMGVLLTPPSLSPLEDQALSLRGAS